MNGEMITLRNVTKRFGRKLAVDGLTLEIPAGEVFALLGPNGAGKTTTIKMIAGLLRPDRGEIRVYGHDVLRNPIQAKHVLAYVPDEPYVYDKLTGREFLEFVGAMYRLHGSELRAEIGRWAAEFEMDGWLDELADSYSHGMRQRLAISAALVHRPKVIIIDEPLVGLDPLTARKVKRILRERAEQGTAILMSTHILSIAEEVADRVGIILDGRIVAVGGVAEIRRRAEAGGNLEEAFLRIVEQGGWDLPRHA